MVKSDRVSQHIDVDVDEGGGHSAILSTFIKLPIIINIFVLSIFEWLNYTGFTVHV